MPRAIAADLKSRPDRLLDVAEARCAALGKCDAELARDQHADGGSSSGGQAGVSRPDSSDGGSSNGRHDVGARRRVARDLCPVRLPELVPSLRMPQVVARKYLRDRHFNNYMALRRAEHGVGAARTPRAGTPPSTASAAVCSSEMRRHSSASELGHLARPGGVGEIFAGLDEIAAEFEGWDCAAPRAFVPQRGARPCSAARSAGAVPSHRSAGTRSSGSSSADSMDVPSWPGEPRPHRSIAKSKPVLREVSRGRTGEYSLQLAQERLSRISL